MSPSSWFSLSGDQSGDTEALSQSTGESANRLPSAQPHRTPGAHPDGPEHSHGERCREGKAVQNVLDRPPVKEKIGNLRKVD